MRRNAVKAIGQQVPALMQERKQNGKLYDNITAEAQKATDQKSEQKADFDLHAAHLKFHLKKQPRRVIADRIEPYFKMQVRSCGLSCTADLGDYLAAADICPLLDENFTAMAIYGL